MIQELQLPLQFFSSLAPPTQQPKKAFRRESEYQAMPRTRTFFGIPRVFPQPSWMERQTQSLLQNIMPTTAKVIRSFTGTIACPPPNIEPLLRTLGTSTR